MRFVLEWPATMCTTTLPTHSAVLAAALSICACGGSSSTESRSLDAGSNASTSGGSGGGSSSGTSGSGGASSGGSADGGGSSGAEPLSVECVADSGGSSQLNPTAKTTAQGTNGAIVSQCDTHGNLIEPVCETQQVCGSFPNPNCAIFYTGNATTETIDCEGHCADGACDGRCPVQGDRFRCVSSDGAGGVVIQDDTVGRRYACTVIFSAPGFDCTSALHAGVQGTVQSLGISLAVTSGTSVYCTGKRFGNLDLTIDGIILPSPYQAEACTLSCDVPP